MGLMTLQLNDEDVEDLTLIFQMANALTFIMIDRLLGGKGEYKDSDRDFTEIEVSIMHSIIGSMSKMLKEPWANYVDLEPKLRGIETNSRVVSAVGYDDTMMICIFEVLIGETKTMITICMPALQLDEIMQKYTQQTVRSSRRFNQEKEDLRLANIKSGVVNSALDVTAVLGEVSVDMFDIINLQVNDIIPLGKSIDSNVAIRIGGRLWFDGKLGTMNSNKAIRIEHVLRALNND
jgi:flagellar motor switch protein FliM